MVMLLLESQEITRAHVVTRAPVTEVKMMFERRNLKYFLLKVTACTCYMHFTVQSYVHVQN